MNKIFKVIFNHTTQTWTAVSELAKGHCKSSSKNTIEVSDERKNSASSLSGIKTIAITSAMMMAVVPSAFAVTAGVEAIKWTSGEGTGIAGGDANGDTNAIAIGRYNPKNENKPTDSNNPKNPPARAWAPGAISIGTDSQVGAQAKDENARGGIAIGFDATTLGKRGVAIGASSKVSGEGAIALGGIANATGEGATAVGFNSTAGTGATAIGRGSQAGTGGIAIGENAQAASPDSIVIGRGTTITDSAHYGTVIIGANITGGSLNSVVIGKQANTGNLESVAVGFGANTSSQKATALGSNATVKDNSMHAIALGSGSEAGAANTVSDLKFKTDDGTTENTATITGQTANSVLSIGNSTHKRQIVNVAAGRVSQDSTDAVNGSQLYAVMKNSGFNIQQNSQAKSRINHDGLVNFANGNYTTAEVEDSNNGATVKMNVVTQGIAVSDKGVTSVSGTSGLTTAKIVSDAINQAFTNSSFYVKANSDTGEKISRGGYIDIVAGDNIEVERQQSTITITTVDSPSFTDINAVKLNAQQVTTKNLTVNEASTLNTLNVNGAFSANSNVNLGGVGTTTRFAARSTIDAGNNKITNLAPGTSSKDAVNKSQLDQVSGVANTARDNAAAANITATNANNTANAANTTATNANNTANAANTTANTALNKVNQGWNITTGQVDGGNVSNNRSTKVQMGDTVSVIAGKNLNISQAGTNITLSINDSPNFTSITTSNGATIGGNLTVNGTT
ncbi:ESPR-type extended signal peptide-containing protein, partial [Rodentibacter trehalosifermentans]|uniref:ESPR-type extended signal peptide-containing protein n=1 Tax=Rodentibacter trehalosifermentans TaxID=1908263 RepID=UPI00241844EB